MNIIINNSSLIPLYEQIGSQIKIQILNGEISQGYITGFIGANGAGKSTTIKLILDMIKKENGSIKIFGEE